MVCACARVWCAPPHARPLRVRTCGAAHNQGTRPNHRLFLKLAYVRCGCRPEQPNAYAFKGQYLFGPSLLVAPITTKATGDLVEKDIWLPPGGWVDWTTATLLHGGASGGSVLKCGEAAGAHPWGMGETPIFVRAGSVVPMRQPLDPQSTGRRILYAVPGAAAATAAGGAGAGGGTASYIYADRGDGLEYADGKARQHRVAKIVQTTTAAGAAIAGAGAVASAGAGAAGQALAVYPRHTGSGYPGEPDNRTYEVRFRCPSALPANSVVTRDGRKVPEVPAPTEGGGEPTRACWWREVEPSPAYISSSSSARAGSGARAHGVARVVVFLPAMPEAGGPEAHWTVSWTGCAA